MQQKTTAYDEEFSSDGSERAVYKKFRETRKINTLALNPAQIKQLQNQPLNDIVKIFPKPFILSQSEAAKIKKALLQRASAMQFFIEDVLLGSNSFSKKVKMENEFSAIFEEVGGTSYADLRIAWKKQKKDQIRFVYGADLFRAPDGEWQVLEDNHGRIGGIAECSAVATKFLHVSGWQAPQGFYHDEDLTIAIKKFLACVNATPDKSLGFLEDDSSGAGISDLEKKRKTQILQALGLPCTNNSQLTNEIRENLREGKYQALVNLDLRSWKPKKELREIFAAAKTPFFEPFGSKFMGHKNFLAYTEEMIRFYLKEEPLIKSPGTRIINSEKSLKEILIQKEENIKSAQKYLGIFKLANSSAGQGLVFHPTNAQNSDWILPVMQWIASKKAVVYQDWVEPSYLDGGEGFGKHSLEMRPIIYAYGFQQFHASGNFYAKVKSIHNSQGHHISSGAQCVPVFIEG